MICREYLVTNPPSDCAALDYERIERVPIATSVSDCILRLGQEDGSGGWMLLVSVLEWVEAHPEGGKEIPAIEWARRIQADLGKKQAAGENPATIASAD